MACINQKSVVMRAKYLPANRRVRNLRQHRQAKSRQIEQVRGMTRHIDVVGCAIALAALLVLCARVQVEAKENLPHKIDGQRFCPASPIGKVASASGSIYLN